MKSYDKSLNVIITFKTTDKFKNKLQTDAYRAEMDLSSYIRALLETKQVVILADSERIAKEFYNLNQHLEQFEKKLAPSDWKTIREEMINICQLLDSLLTKINNIEI